MRLILSSALGLALGFVALAACSQSTPIDVDPAASFRVESGGSSLCAADSYQTLVGQLAGEIDTDSLPQPMRVLSSSDALAARPTVSRLTLITGGDGRVAEVVCN